MTPEHKAKMAAGRVRAQAEKVAKAMKREEARVARNAVKLAPMSLSTAFKSELEAGMGTEVTNDFIGAGVGPAMTEANRLTVTLGGSPIPVLPVIDYDALAQAMIRAQAKANEEREAMKPAGGPVLPPVTRDDRGMPVQGAYDTNLVRPGNNPVTRILAQLTFPADKTAQVVAMIAANMAPSWSEFNQEITDQPHAPVGEKALVAYLQEYCMQLRPELPKTYLEPMYKNHTPEAAPLVPSSVPATP